ncbi:MULTISPECIES: DUF5384 family protein [Acetobacteraceae]|nr:MULTISPECIES: DUF5384 family protein [Acetobacteraceae]MCQ0042168.1 DUF5384 family protein [Bombella sp.]MPW00056.1 hypothetical protein [Bombella apis]MUH01898.1 hypothetical protein [Bombella sp. ESL0387]
MMRSGGWNRMLLALVLAAPWGMGGAALAQATDPAQLETLGRIQDSQDQRRLALEAAQQQAARATQQRQERLRRQAADSAARIAAARNSRSDAEWQDDRRYKEASRELELKEEQLKLKMLETRASREDDVIKADLARKQAETDRVIQTSQGDAKLKADVGTAARMAQRHWWESN